MTTSLAGAHSFSLSLDLIGLVCFLIWSFFAQLKQVRSKCARGCCLFYGGCYTESNCRRTKTFCSPFWNRNWNICNAGLERLHAVFTAFVYCLLSAQVALLMKKYKILNATPISFLSHHCHFTAAALKIEALTAPFLLCSSIFAYSSSPITAKFQHIAVYLFVHYFVSMPHNLD